MNTIQEYITLIKDIVTILATITAAIVAIKGFETWKKQLNWKTQYEIAQRLLRATYKLRDALAIVRTPLMDEGENFWAKREAMNQGYSIDHSATTIHRKRLVYKERWQQVQEAINDIDSVSLEAEAIWGLIVKSKLKPLIECSAMLFTTLESYLNEAENPIKHDEETYDRTRRIIYAFPHEEGNFFSIKISDAIIRIEEFLIPHLGN
jgi:hypothetical protein